VGEGCRDLPVRAVMLSAAGVGELLLADPAADLRVLLNTVLLLVF